MLLLLHGVFLLVHDSLFTPCVVLRVLNKGDIVAHLKFSKDHLTLHSVTKGIERVS